MGLVLNPDVVEEPLKVALVIIAMLLAMKASNYRGQPLMVVMCVMLALGSIGAVVALNMYV
ncbi:hypothetical protein EXS54_01930 [Patescibacteria group bacterium]|nr:hypothetical protein [Patescibacteria group bacterium]